MRIAQNVCALALRQLIGGACKAVGCTPGAGLASAAARAAPAGAVALSCG